LPAPLLPPRLPTTIIRNEALLQSVEKFPRHHLGSTLYRPIFETPSSLSSPSVEKICTGAGRPIPRFEGKANCTFTVRVPRYYMKSSEREKICRRQALWGVDVYTDDSDPLAAAMHAGWIRGAWGEGFDPSILEPNSSTSSTTVLNNSAASSSTCLNVSARPPQPLIPPSGKDLHLTLLILPALRTYASQVRHGIKSRAWGETHDGMSFKIEKMSWVEEGAGYGEERGAEARRKRMKTRQSIAPGPPLRLNTQKPKIDSTQAMVVSPTSG
jgi:hypothetical protein